MGYTCIFIVLSSTFWTLLHIPKSKEPQPPRLALKEPVHDFSFAFATPRVGLWGGRQDWLSAVSKQWAYPKAPKLLLATLERLGETYNSYE